MAAKILRLNMAGQPIEWLNWKQCVNLYARDLVGWSLGGMVYRARGGKSRLTGLQSYLDLPAIVACDGSKLTPINSNPPLSNQGLFNRDNGQCLYCGHFFTFTELSRDHVQPTSRGGENKWENVVAACKRCNQHKGNLLLSETNMQLIALPYRPNPYEYLALINSDRIRGDQMAYLRPKFSKYTGRLIQSHGRSYHFQLNSLH